MEGEFSSHVHLHRRCQLRSLFSFGGLEVVPSCMTSHPYSGPSVDGDLIPDSPHDLLAQGKFAQIPYSIRNVEDELVSRDGWRSFDHLKVNVSQRDLHSRHRERFGSIKQFLNLGEPFGIDPSIVDQLFQLYPDNPALGS